MPVACSSDGCRANARFEQIWRFLSEQNALCCSPLGLILLKNRRNSPCALRRVVVVGVTFVPPRVPIATAKLPGKSLKAAMHPQQGFQFALNCGLSVSICPGVIVKLAAIKPHGRGSWPNRSIPKSNGDRDSFVFPSRNSLVTNVY